MDLISFLSKLKECKIEYKTNENMSGHTTFKIGGNADVLVFPLNKEQLILCLNYARKYSVSYFVLGKGSNILVSDFGIEGAVISLCKFDEMTIDGKTITCGAGQNLSALCVAAQKEGLSGVEFAYGIPGSVGGALFMNAGAYGGEMSQVVKGAYCLDNSGNELFIDKDDMELAYRSSIFRKNGMIILNVVFELFSGDKSEISKKMTELIQKRKEKQPLEYPSAGSTFKRPVENFAGTLIEKNGLKGLTVGGAMVSKKHAGFIINYDNATATDVSKLIETVKETVYKGDNVMLEPEVIFVGRK